MAKSKYTPDRIELIYAVLEKTGSDRAVIADPEIGISKPTYYQWQKDNPDFLNGVAKAKQHYRINQPDWQKYQATQVLVRYLTEGAIETWESEDITYDAEGKLTERKVTTKTVKRGVPSWVIDRILGNDKPDILHAMNVLVSADLMPEKYLKAIAAGLADLENRLKAVDEPG